MSSSSRPIVIAGNWKMHKTIDDALDYTGALATLCNKTSLPDNLNVIIAPSFIALSKVQDKLNSLNAPICVAAQTMEASDEGAYTGETSPLMLTDLGLKHVILGHSERRQYYNETSDTVASKTTAALSHGLIPIVCVGESDAERSAGSTDTVIKNQLSVVLDALKKEDVPNIMVAYEPVWAIGTGKTCDAAEANRVCALIRTLINTYGEGDRVPVLYGGSVKAQNSPELLSQSDVDGALVGGASLDPNSFYGIIEAAMQLQTANAN